MKVKKKLYVIDAWGKDKNPKIKPKHVERRCSNTPTDFKSFKDYFYKKYNNVLFKEHVILYYDD